MGTMYVYLLKFSAVAVFIYALFLLFAPQLLSKTAVKVQKITFDVDSFVFKNNKIMGIILIAASLITFFYFKL